jgi:lysophospholipase L1-like esterase
MLARDGFHPGPAGHAAWAALLATAIADDIN